jgi:hypothetical protein
MHNHDRLESGPNFFSNKLPNVNNHLSGEKSPNLVTLLVVCKLRNTHSTSYVLHTYTQGLSVSKVLVVWNYGKLWRVKTVATRAIAASF